MYFLFRHFIPSNKLSKHITSFVKMRIGQFVLFSNENSTICGIFIFIRAVMSFDGFFDSMRS